MLAAGYGYSTVKQERLRWTDADGKRRSTSPRNHPVVAAHLAEMRAKASNRSGGELPLSPHQPLTPPTSHPTNLSPHQPLTPPTSPPTNLHTNSLTPLTPLTPPHPNSPPDTTFLQPPISAVQTTYSAFAPKHPWCYALENDRRCTGTPPLQRGRSPRDGVTEATGPAGTRGPDHVVAQHRGGDGHAPLRLTRLPCTPRSPGG